MYRQSVSNPVCISVFLSNAAAVLALLRRRSSEVRLLRTSAHELHFLLPPSGAGDPTTTDNSGGSGGGDPKSKDSGSGSGGGGGGGSGYGGSGCGGGLPELLEDLQRHGPRLGVTSYGLQTTSMEDVFLRLTRHAHGEHMY